MKSFLVLLHWLTAIIGIFIGLEAKEKSLGTMYYLVSMLCFAVSSCLDGVAKGHFAYHVNNFIFNFLSRDRMTVPRWLSSVLSLMVLYHSASHIFGVWYLYVPAMMVMIVLFIALNAASFIWSPMRAVPPSSVSSRV